MPLSEEERRILTEIEAELSASDPGLAKEVSTTTVYTGPLRRTRLAVAGVVVGIVLTLVLLTVNAVLAFVVGFGLMLVSAWALERNIRDLGRVGMQQVTTGFRRAGLREFFNSAGDRARDRLQRDED